MISTIRIMKIKLLTTSLFITILLFSSFILSEDWGFFGHRRINRMAVFTLPQEMILFYKMNIEYLTEHAVDPDKRRYATKHEAVRHYIDIDHWGERPFETVPRKWDDVLTKYMEIYVVNDDNDTTVLFSNDINIVEEGKVGIRSQLVAGDDIVSLDYETYRDFVKDHIITQYYEDEWILSCGKLDTLLEGKGVKLDCATVFAKESFSQYGILPYHLELMQARLTKAFKKKDPKRILQLSAEMGHYIGDAHVPLHTTENYNGQLTNQDGIHGFWESRIPELFADEEYDYFVGVADYIDDKNEYFWGIVKDSNTYVDSIFRIEKRLSQTFAIDQQFCYEDRNGKTIRTQCKEYTRAFSKLLENQVEDRMVAAIHSVGSSWYTAWVDAGQPDLDSLMRYKLSEEDKKELEALEKQYRGGEIKGRKHGS